MSFVNLKIGMKLGVVFGFLLMMLVVTIVFGLGCTGKVNSSVEEIAKRSYHKTVQASRASQAIHDITGSIRLLVLLKDAKAIEKENARVEEARTRYRESMRLLAEAETSEKGKTLIENIKTTLAPAVEVNNRVMALTREGRQDEAIVMLVTEGAPMMEKLQAAFDEQLTFQQENVEKAYQASVQTYQRAKLVQIVAGTVSVLLGLLAAVFLIRNLTTRINRVANTLSRVADGDLTTQLRIYAEDEIGDLGKSINRTITSIGGIITSVKKTASEVSSAAHALCGGAEQIATGVEEVAAQAGTVATASEEMAATSSEIAGNCHTAAESSQQASDLAREGVAVVQETVVGMGRIAERVKQTALTVERLGARSDEIGEIIGTIEDIADQTNLLALNAAIEAARAGEQGRGFAVVADEVRALAERTTRATKEIGQMIRDIQAETKGAVISMEEGVQEVAHGTVEADKSRSALEDILNQITAVTSQIDQIASAAQQQNATTSEITHNIQQITEVVQDSASCAQETSSAANRLTGHSEELQRLVGRFILA